MEQSEGRRQGPRYVAMGLLGAALGASIGGAPKLLALGGTHSGATHEAVSAATPGAVTALAGARYEIIAFEAQGCTYCAHFRKDIARSYERSERSKRAPVRYLDVKAGEVANLKLAGAITLLPTAVILRDGIEIGRIDGYTGRENFYRVLDTLVPE